MSQPAVTITELDGALGVLPPSSGALLAVVGASSLGDVDTPTTFARVRDLVAAFGVGPLVEAAARHIELTGRPVVVVRTGQTTAGDYGAVDDDDVTGTANGEITETPATEPLDDYEAAVRIVVGGTTGTTGITYQTSLDGGRTWGAVTALGTGLAIAITGAGVSFTITTGKTLVAGDQWTCRTSAPQANSTELGTALDALKGWVGTWEIVEIVGALDATLFDTVDTKLLSMASAGKWRTWIGHARTPNVGENEATYKSALDTIFSAKASSRGVLCAGACKLTSSVSGRKYRRPISVVASSLEASLSQEVNSADLSLGALVGVSIRDANGNADEHDETLSPGLDDSRHYVLRTWEGRQGVYVNRPRIFSSEGSDFLLVPHRRVLNLAHQTLRAYLELRLNKPIRVDRATGFILEADALEIEAGANAALAGVLLVKPKASDASFALARNDNILSTRTLTGDARVTPLGYPEAIEIEVGFLNPALQVQQT